MSDSTPRCGSTKSDGSGHCTQIAGWGTTHVGVGRCKLHGGASPLAELSGQLVIARHEAQVMGVPLPADPLEAILQCIAIAAGEVRYCSDRIAELEERDAAGPVRTITTKPVKGGGKDDRTTEIQLGPPALHIWIKARHEAMDRLVVYSKVALANKIDERRVDLAKRQAETVAEAMRLLATRLGHDPAEPKVREAMRGSLTVIAAGAA